MLPVFLVQALFGLGGVCFVLFITVFHNFRDKVDSHIVEEMRAFFSSPQNHELLEKIGEGSLPPPVIRDFSNELLKTSAPRRKLRSVLLLLPLDGCLFILSASLASLSAMENEVVMSFLGTLEFLANSTLLAAFVVVFVWVYQLVKLAYELT